MTKAQIKAHRQLLSSKTHREVCDLALEAMETREAEAMAERERAAMKPRSK